MAPEHSIFISYSRQQLYFVEALSKRLQKAGVDVWMDLQQLEPGEDWRAQIRDALQACTALVLVGSRQALASPYVQEEWGTALSAGKPVVIALYEAVDLPEALQQVPLIDFRGRFKPAVQTLAACLLHGRTVKQPVPRPNRLNLPTKLPPGIRIVTLALLLAALLTPPFLLDSFPPIFPPILVLLNGLIFSATLLWYTWRFLHHRFSPQIAVAPFFIPVVIYGFYQMSAAIQGDFDESLEIKWMVMIGIGFLLYGIMYLVLGPELLRWSAPGEMEIQLFRRWFNKPARRKSRTATASMLNTMLAARTDQPLRAPAPPMSHEAFQVATGPELPSPETYSLHYARNDRPVAASLRRALRRQKLREMERGGDVHILILSQFLPRIQLQELLQASVRKVLLLVGNVSLQGDALMEQAARLQIIDFRDRTGKVLKALARTLKDLTTSTLPVGLESTPKSFDETVLPLGARQFGYWVLSAGVYLLLSGLAALILGLLGLISLQPLDLPGILIGPWLIRQGRRFWSRRTTRWAFIPAFAFSTWLNISVFFLAFFLFSLELPPDPLQWILTPSKLLVLDEEFPLLCFLPFTFFLVPFMLLDHIVRYWNWLPASARRARGQACLPPLRDERAVRWVFYGWLVGAFLAFGLPLGMYLIYYALFHVLRFPF